MNITKLIFNKYFHSWIKFWSRLISHKFVYLLVLACLVTMNLNINFLHEKMPFQIRQEIYYRINYMLDLENLKNIDSFELFFKKLQTMIVDSRVENDLFKVNRFSLHFLSKTPLGDMEVLFDQPREPRRPVHVFERPARDRLRQGEPRVYFAL